MPQTESIIGCLLGTAVGDALGLPYEGLSRQRIRKIAPKINDHRFIFGKGMVSDDTEHTCMVAQSLIVSGGEEKQFTQFKFWLLGLPAGIGFATLRGIVKLWIGFPAHCSGVFSAGNGAAMRSVIIGVCYGTVPGKLSELVKISTRLTHRDPKAEYGAMAVAISLALSN